jgi:dipeptidyl aminopeptidase/acylaminoacyl peptidase
LLDSVDFRPAEHLWFKGSDNKMIEVMLIKPHNFHENEKYPLIVNVHGGPQSQ